MTAAAKKAEEEIELALTSEFLTRIDVSAGVQLFILRDDEIPCGLLCQWNDKWEDKLHVLEWIFFVFQVPKNSSRSV